MSDDTDEADPLADEGHVARVAGMRVVYRNAHDYIAYVNALSHNSALHGDEPPKVEVDALACEIGNCPEDPRDGLALNGNERGLLT